MKTFEERQRDAYLEKRSSFGELPTMNVDIAPDRVRQAAVTVICMLIAALLIVFAAFTSK